MKKKEFKNYLFNKGFDTTIDKIGVEGKSTLKKKKKRPVFISANNVIVELDNGDLYGVNPETTNDWEYTTMGFMIVKVSDKPFKILETSLNTDFMKKGTDITLESLDKRYMEEIVEVLQKVEKGEFIISREVIKDSYEIPRHKLSEITEEARTLLKNFRLKDKTEKIEPITKKPSIKKEVKEQDYYTLKPI